MKKRIITTIMGVFVVIVAFALFQYLYGGSPDNLEPTDSFEVIAHRGVHTNWEKGAYDRATGCEATHIYEPTHEYIENTLESIEAAFDYGATIVEIDIRGTSDDHLVVFHDYMLECRTDGEGEVSDHTLAYLRTLDIGYGYTHDNGDTYPLRGRGVGRIPTLVEVLEAFPDRRFLIDHKDASQETAALLVDVIRSLEPEQRELLYYWGPPELYEAYIRTEVPEVARLFANRPEAKECFSHYLLTFGVGGFPDTCSGLGIGMPPEYTAFVWGWPFRFLESVEQADMRFYLMIDTEEDAQEFADLPVDGIVTDYIEVIGEYYRE